jgi:hypothetical protein
VSRAQACHDIEIGGMNYLVPVDAKLSRDTTWTTKQCRSTASSRSSVPTFLSRPTIPFKAVSGHLECP